MLDDLRNSSSFEEEEPQEGEGQSAVFERPTRRRRGDFLGMTAPQRFILSLMLLFMVCVVGSFLLLLFGKVVLF